MITYTVSDGTLTDETGTFTVTVTAVADAPVAVANTLTVAEDAALTSTDVIANDTDGDGDTLSLTAATTAGTGTVAVNADGLSVDYTPAANFNGTEVITYTVSDGTLTDATGTFTVTVTAVNDAPVAVANTLTVAEDAALTSTDVIANDTDVEDETLSLTAATTAGTGTVAVNADGLSVDYTPAANFNGTEVITYTVSDGTDTTNGTFTITVTAVNDAPVAVDDTATVAEDAALSSTDVIANDTDVDGSDTLSLTAVTSDGSGTVAVNENGLSVDYTPAANFYGKETITYTVSDGTLTDETGTLTVTVSAVNDAPLATNQSVTTVEETSKEITHTGTDVDKDLLKFIIVSLPTNGTLKDGDTEIISGNLPVTLSSTNATYTPNSNYSGSDSYTFKVKDLFILSDPATVSISVSGVNDAPFAANQSVTTDEETTKEITHSGTDKDGDVLTYILTSLPTNGILKENGTKISSGELPKNLSSANLLYVPYTNYPDGNFTGVDSYTFKVNDGTLESLEAAKISILINPVNDTPIATPQSVTTIEDIPLNMAMTGTDDDMDELTYSFVDYPTNGSITKDGAKVVYVPQSGFFGLDSFTFKVNDGTVDSSPSKVSITVTSNDFDEDGVLNDKDECPNTPTGTIVDIKGCEVFSILPKNNKVEVISATCIGNSDGAIGLSVENNSHDYTISITGPKNDIIKISGTNKTASLTGLSKGNYTVCFKVDGKPNYEECFEVVIEEPKALSAFIDVDNDKKSTSIQLSGSNFYNIDVNGERFEVKGDRFNASLPTGLNTIKVSTNLDCQGVIEQEIFISEDIMYYPNPTQRDVKVHVSGKDSKVMISVFSEKGDLIYRKEQEIKDFSRLTEIDLSLQITGTYIVVMEGPTVRKTFKILRK